MKDERNAPGPDRASVSPPQGRDGRGDRPAIAAEPAPAGPDTERLSLSEQASKNEREALESGEESAT